MFPLDQPLKLSSDVEWTDVGGEIVLLDTRQSLFFSLNETSTAIWKRLQEGHTVNEVIGFLTQEYEADEPGVRTDVLIFVHALVRNGLAEA